MPTIFDADTRSLVEIATATRALAAKVRDGTVSPPELAGGTFTVSNLGMFGVARFTAVINPPQAAILAVGAALAARGRRRRRHGQRAADHGADDLRRPPHRLRRRRRRLPRHRPQAARAPGRAAALSAGAGDAALLAAHDIALVRAPNPGPYTLSGTNSWIVGRDPAYVIDPGPALDGAPSTALAAELDAPRRRRRDPADPRSSPTTRRASPRCAGTTGAPLAAAAQRREIASPTASRSAR